MAYFVGLVLRGSFIVNVGEDTAHTRPHMSEKIALFVVLASDAGR